VNEDFRWARRARVRIEDLLRTQNVATTIAIGTIGVDDDATRHLQVDACTAAAACVVAFVRIGAKISKLLATKRLDVVVS
jgi:hypothetical protein